MLKTSHSSTRIAHNSAAKVPHAVLPTIERGRCRAICAKLARRGAAATEFAVVAPVFFLMIAGFIEFGRALMVQQVLINASRVGARQASTTSATSTEVQTTVQEYAASLAVAGVSVAIVPDPSAANPGDPVTVTTSVPFTNVSWLASPWFLGGTTLQASSQMRKEGFE